MILGIRQSLYSSESEYGDDSTIAIRDLLCDRCHQDSMLPVSRPVIGVDGREMSEVFVPKGTKIFISTLASNRNAVIWGPDAYEWKPERWLSSLPDAVVNAKIPGVYSHL